VLIAKGDGLNIENQVGGILTLNTLSGRFKRRHYKNPVQEAKKYLIGEEN